MINRKWSVATFGVALLGLGAAGIFACSSSSSGSAPGVDAGGNDSETDAASSPEDAGPDVGPYPAGPYGYDAGSVLEDFSVQGYDLSPATTNWGSSNAGLPLATLQLSTFRAAHPSCQCMILDLGGTTQNGPPGIEANVQHALEKLVTDPTYCVFSSLQILCPPAGCVDVPDGGDAGPALVVGEGDLSLFVRIYHQTFPVALPNDMAQAIMSQAPRAFPKEVFVDPATMTIKKVQVGVGGDPSVDGQVATLKTACK
jgi:hypothetical protein